MPTNTIVWILLLFLAWTPHVLAERFDIRKFGAGANDDTDDTGAILKTLSACEAAGGGEVFVPAGTYLVSRQGAESPILNLPSNTTIRGEGAASILKFDPRVNESNFWRMLGPGCRNVTIRDVAVKNFVRQGIQMAGGNGARDYLVTGCHDLAGDVESGGSTIHVEHARGLKNVIITNNRCRRSILAGGVDGIVIRNNVITGRLVGNGNLNAVVAGNVIRGREREGPIVQFGYASGMILKDNIIIGGHDEAGGIYVWGTSRYNPEPSRDVAISGNVVRVGGRGVFLNGVDDGRVEGNVFSLHDEQKNVVLKRTRRIRVDRADIQR